MKTQHAIILNAIIDYMDTNNRPPTTREISTATGYSSTATINYYLREMRDLSIIDFIDRSPRSISVAGYKYRKEEA